MSITADQLKAAMGPSFLGPDRLAPALNAAFANNLGQTQTVIGGTAVLDGSNPTPIVTGLTTVVGVQLTLGSAVAPGLNTSILTYAISGGTINVYGWKPTSATDPTLIASTGVDAFSWVVVGTL
jgi:hypothetical protein